jgi:hypothetical protein
MRALKKKEIKEQKVVNGRWKGENCRAERPAFERAAWKQKPHQLYWHWHHQSPLAVSRLHAPNFNCYHLQVEAWNSLRTLQEVGYCCMGAPKQWNVSFGPWCLWIVPTTDCTGKLWGYNSTVASTFSVLVLLGLLHLLWLSVSSVFKWKIHR